jgi:hypothetical protein
MFFYSHFFKSPLKSHKCGLIFVGSITHDMTQESPGVAAGWHETGYAGWRMPTFNSDGASADEAALVGELREGKIGLQHHCVITVSPQQNLPRTSRPAHSTPS